MLPLKFNLMANLTIVTLILLFSSALSLDPDPENTDAPVPKDCEPPETPAQINNTAGYLPFGHFDPDRTCSWLINSSAKAEAFLYLESVQLGENDTVKIYTLKENGTAILIKEITESIESGLLFTGSKDLIRVDVTTSNDTSSRFVHIFFSNDGSTSSVTINQDSVMKLMKLDKTYTPATKAIKRDFTLSLPSSNKIKKLVASVDRLAIVNLVLGGKPFVLDTSSDVIGNPGITFSLDISDITNPANDFELSVYMVNTDCGGLIPLSATTSKGIVEVDSDRVQRYVDILCLWIVTTDTNSQLNIIFEGDKSDLPVGNHLIIRKGNRKSSPVLVDISSLNYDTVKANIFNSLIDSSSLFITYEAFKTAGEHPHMDVLRSPVKNFISGSGAIKIDASSKDAPKKYLFQATGSRALMTTKSTPLSTNLSIYDDAELVEDNLLLCLKAGDLLPDTIWSNSNLLVFAFFDPPKSIDVTLTSQTEVAGSTARQSKGSLVLLGNQQACGKSYQWLIPASHVTVPLNDPKTIHSLVISNLVLEKDGTMVIKEVTASSPPHVFTIKGNDVEGSETLPNLYLNSSLSHYVTYTRPAKCDQKSQTLLQASVDVIYYDECQNVEVKAPRSLKSYNYPNNYPLTDYGISSQCGVISSSESHLYITFEDLDLYDSHLLEIAGGKGTFNFTKSTLPSDLIVEQKVVVNFNRPFNPKPDTTISLGQRLSGKGFKATVEPLKCGSMMTLDAGSIDLTSNSTDECTWIISAPKAKDGKTIRTLNFTVPQGLKDIKIYDSDTKRNNTLIDLKTSNGTFYSTTETIIVSFKPQTSGDAKLEWASSDCEESCQSVRKCILPSMKCNDVNDCGDNSDEIHCNGTKPLPPQPKIESGGVPGLVVVFVIMPLSIIVGVICTILAPRVLARLRGGHYQEFREYADVS